MSAVGVVFSNIHDENVPELSRQRTMGSLPFGGRYRLIDFALSNPCKFRCDDGRHITKNNYQSLMDHLGSGKDWDLAVKPEGWFCSLLSATTTADCIKTGWKR